MRRQIRNPLWGPLLILGLLLLAGGCALYQGGEAARRQSLAKEILSHPRISLANFHVSGRRDRATALDNLRQTAQGRKARRSAYGRAPGGSTYLDARMLRAMIKLADEGLRLRVTEVAGGSHSNNSRHYYGVAFDVDYINGHKVGYGNPYVRRVMKRCRQLGATEILGPGDPGHRSHLHIAWPRSR